MIEYPRVGDVMNIYMDVDDPEQKQWNEYDLWGDDGMWDDRETADFIAKQIESDGLTRRIAVVRIKNFKVGGGHHEQD